MKRTSINVLVIVLLWLSVGQAQDTIAEPQVTLTNFEDHITGFRYVWRIPRSTLVRLPVWSPLESEPPLLPHDAVIVATRYLAVVIPSPTKLTVYAVALEKHGMDADKDIKALSALWAYHISFTADPEPSPQLKAQLEVLVTLDGNVIKPIITPLK